MVWFDVPMYTLKSEKRKYLWLNRRKIVVAIICETNMQIQLFPEKRDYLRPLKPKIHQNAKCSKADTLFFF